jgi:hypothetical protein
MLANTEGTNFLKAGYQTSQEKKTTEDAHNTNPVGAGYVAKSL